MGGAAVEGVDGPWVKGINPPGDVDWARSTYLHLNRVDGALARARSPEDKGPNGEVQEGNVALRRRSPLEARSGVVVGEEGEEWLSDQEGQEGWLRQAAVDARGEGVERVRRFRSDARQHPGPEVQGPDC